MIILKVLTIYAEKKIKMEILKILYIKKNTTKNKFSNYNCKKR